MNRTRVVGASREGSIGEDKGEGLEFSSPTKIPVMRGVRARPGL